jgi:iron complex transport system substrate-binding protein
MRICSLLPSATEIVAMLGLADRLVAVSAECDWPPDIRGRPVVSAARIETSQLSTGTIDQAVRRALADGRSLYAVDAELVERLNPDLILTQDLCAVCAVSSGDLALCRIGVETLAVDARSISEIATSVLRLADRLGVRARGNEVVGELWERIRLAGATVAARRPRPIFVAEWLDPPFAAGHWVPEMVAAAGGRDVLGRAGAPSFRTTWDEVAHRQPELIVLAPCGFDADRAATEARRLALSLPAPAVAVDAHSYFSRPSPRIADGLEQLAWLLHPEAVAAPALPLVTLDEARGQGQTRTATYPSTKGATR